MNVRIKHLLTLTLLLMSGVVLAQAFPSKAVRLVVPFGPGGVADLTARAVAQGMSQGLGQSVVIDNRPGAGGVLAGETVARAEPDGHTLLLISNGTAVSAGLFKTLPYDTLADFAPISTLAFFDLGIVTGAPGRFKDLAALLTYARANPGKFNLGSINVGSTQHLAAELFKTLSGVPMQIVPFNGTPALIVALRGGQVDAAVEILGPVLPQIKSGALGLLAVGGERRNAGFPDVPTVIESGVGGYMVSSWNALAAPARTPRPVIDRLQREINTALANPAIARQLRELNVEARASSPEQTAELLRSEVRRWTDVIQRSGVPRQ